MSYLQPDPVNSNMLVAIYELLVFSDLTLLRLTPSADLTLPRKFGRNDADEYLQYDFQQDISGFHGFAMADRKSYLCASSRKPYKIYQMILKVKVLKDESHPEPYIYPDLFFDFTFFLAVTNYRIRLSAHKSRAHSHPVMGD